MEDQVGMAGSPPDGFVPDDQNKVVQLDGPSAQRLESRAAICNDLAFVLSTCSLLISHLETEADSEEGRPLTEALWTAILIAYERCFSSGKRTSLSYSDLDTIDPSGGARKLHKYYEAMRNKHLAHSINPFATVQIGAILANRSSGRREVDGIGVATARHTSADVDEVRQLGGLVGALLRLVGEECEELSRVQVFEEARAIDIEELYAREDMCFTVPGPEAAREPRRRGNS